MDKLCKNCKFWESDKETPTKYLNYKRSKWKDCLKMAANCLEPNYQDSLAMSYETGESENRVLTSPDFGCVMFQEKK